MFHPAKHLNKHEQHFRQQNLSIVLDVHFSNHPISFAQGNFGIAIRSGHAPNKE
jgi:hypothetical protein